MKKRTWIVSASLTLMLVACGKTTKQNGTVVTNGVAATTATTLNANCLNQPYIVNNPFNTGCNHIRINNSAFTAYPAVNGYYRGYDTGFSNGFEHCTRQGLVPAYDPQIGLYCVQPRILQQVHHTYRHHYPQYHQPSFPMWQWNAVSFKFKFHGRYQVNSWEKGFGGRRALRLCRPGTPHRARDRRGRRHHREFRAVCRRVGDGIGIYY